MSLGRHYRFVAYNNTGVALAAGAIAIRARRWNFNTSAQQAWEPAEVALDANAATVGTAAYWTGATINNSVPYVGGDFTFVVTVAGTPAGTVTVYLQRSTDGGTTWPDNGRGTVLRTFGFAAAGTQTDVVGV